MPMQPLAHAPFPHLWLSGTCRSRCRDPKLEMELSPGEGTQDKCCQAGGSSGHGWSQLGRGWGWGFACSKVGRRHCCLQKTQMFSLAWFEFNVKAATNQMAREEQVERQQWSGGGRGHFCLFLLQGKAAS